MELTHINKDGKAVMVDITNKSATDRVAEASAFVRMKPETLQLILDQKIKKGDVFAAARIAGIMAAKRTPDLIPMCHPIPITSAEVELDPIAPDGVRITVTVKTTYSTGVEMEALSAASVAALTIYDMCKSVDRGMTIEEIKLLKKSGGKSGEFTRGDKE